MLYGPMSLDPPGGYLPKISRWARLLHKILRTADATTVATCAGDDRALTTVGPRTYYFRADTPDRTVTVQFRDYAC